MHDTMDKKECGEGLGTHISSLITGKAVGETILYAMLNRSKIAMTTIKVTA